MTAGCQKFTVTKYADNVSDIMNGILVPIAYNLQQLIFFYDMIYS